MKTKYILKMAMRIFSSILAMTLLFCLTACGGESPEKTASTTVSGSDFINISSAVSDSGNTSLISSQPCFDSAMEAYYDQLNKIKDETEPNRTEAFMSCFFKDIDGNGIDELCVKHQSEIKIYTFSNEKLTEIGSHDFSTGTLRIFSSEDSDYPGIFCFTAGGSAEHYKYLTIKDNELSLEYIWRDQFAFEEMGYPERTDIEYTTDKAMIEESKYLYDNSNDIEELKLQTAIEVINQSDIKLLLLEVMNNNKPFLAENGSETLLRDYKIPNVIDEIPIIAEEYAFVDLDGDNINELIVKCTTNYGLYLILHYDRSDGNVYGFSMGVRSFIDVKADGTFMGSGGAMINVISKASFDKSNMRIEDIAVNNASEKIYKINGKSVTKTLADNYFKQWSQKETPIWSKEHIL